MAEPQVTKIDANQYLLPPGSPHRLLLAYPASQVGAGFTYLIRGAPGPISDSTLTCLLGNGTAGTAFDLTVSAALPNAPCHVHLVPTALRLATVLDPLSCATFGVTNAARALLEDSTSSSAAPVPTPSVTSSSSIQSRGGGRALQEDTMWTVNPADFFVRVVLVANMTIDAASWPTSGVNVNLNVTVTSVPGVLTQLSFGNMLSLFNIAMEGQLRFQGIVLADLAVGPEADFPYSMATWALWAVQPYRWVEQGVNLV